MPGVAGASQQPGPSHICSPSAEPTVARPIFLGLSIILEDLGENMSFMQMHLYLEHNAYVHMEIQL